MENNCVDSDKIPWTRDEVDLFMSLYVSKPDIYAKYDTNLMFLNFDKHRYDFSMLNNPFFLEYIYICNR